jgi:glycosyltransferase involved in cell wall biosynthesis
MKTQSVLPAPGPLAAGPSRISGEPRLAIVQHGDYVAARKTIEAGPESYFGMRYSVGVLEELLANRPHLLISLNAPAYRTGHRGGMLMGLPCPRVRGIPRSLLTWVWAGRIVRQLRLFRPTHLLLRTSGMVGWRILQAMSTDKPSTLVLLANLFAPRGVIDHCVTRRLISLLNEPWVWRVGNHRPPATQTLVEHGLRPDKAVAYDWPGQRQPEDYPVKPLPRGTWEIVFIGNMIRSKGTADLIEAVALLHAQGAAVRLTAIGTGAGLEEFQRRAAGLPPGLVTFTGQIPNEEAFERLKAATLACVPTRPEFAEGMPYTLTEALAARTPVIVSDHPVFVRAFREGQGVRFFRAGEPRSLAETIRRIMEDAQAYEELSRATLEAMQGIRVNVTFADMIVNWMRASRCGGGAA